MPTELVTIGEYLLESEAELLRTVLADEGIQSYVENEAAGQILWLWRYATGAAKLQVAEVDAERARSILEQRYAEFSKASDESEETEQQEGDKDEETAEAAGDHDAIRAWRAAVFGTFFLPILLHFYSLWIILQVALKDAPLSRSGKRHYYAALLLDLCGGVLVGLLVWLFRSFEGWAWWATRH